MPDGNDVQVRALAQTLFDVWKAEQEQEQRRRILGGSIPAWVACALSIGGIISLAGGTNQRVNDTERRVGVLEARDRAQEVDSRQMGEKLSSIESKVDLLVAQSK